MAQVCFTIADAKAVEVRQALLEETYTEEELATFDTSAKKTEAARLAIVRWVRTIYWNSRIRKEVDSDNSVT